jgi:DNA polymerase-3 subunit alpha
VDFLKKVDLGTVNITSLEALIKSGALDNLGIKRSQMLLKFDDLYERISSRNRGRNEGQTSFFDLVQKEEEKQKEQKQLRML